MLRFEQDDRSVPEGYAHEIVAYHVNQLVERGLVDGDVVWRTNRGHKVPGQYFVFDITPSGHDFISAIRNETFWARLKKRFEDATAPLTVELIVHCAKQLGKQLLGLEEKPPTP